VREHGDIGVGLFYLALAALALLAAITLVHTDSQSIGRLVSQPLPAPRYIDLDSLYGVASWYGKPFHGRRTASGQIYDMGGYSVASRTIPMGTFVLITNLENGRQCIAVVNDRGPYVEGRDWDVSAAVAGRLGMVYHGVVPVKVRILL
jgi:rare lipoprotein A